VLSLVEFPPPPGLDVCTHFEMFSDYFVRSSFLHGFLRSVPFSLQICLYWFLISCGQIT
jgi:hypothetical protein